MTASPPLARGSRLGAVAPVPFVGAATLLIALIVFTPVLLAPGPSPLAVQAELVVYRVAGAPKTDFAVHAVGSNVPYARIDVGLGTWSAWNGGCPGSSVRVNWTYSNETNLLSASVFANASTPVLVNATVIYSAAGTTTTYAAEIAFDVQSLGLPGESLAIASCTPGESPPSSWSVSNLPLSLLLVNYGSGGPP